MFKKIEFKPESCHYFGVIFLHWNHTEIKKKIFCCPALELFHCLPLWKTVLFVSSRAFLLSTPTFLFSTPVKKSEATWKKATKCNKDLCSSESLTICFFRIRRLVFRAFRIAKVQKSNRNFWHNLDIRFISHAIQ